MLDLESIGHVLKRRRATLGLSQAAVAAKAGATQPQISALERGANVRASTLLSISRALGLEPMFVPREILPVVEAILEAPGREAQERPLYALEDEES